MTKDDWDAGASGIVGFLKRNLPGLLALMLGLLLLLWGKGAAKQEKGQEVQGAPSQEAVSRQGDLGEVEKALSTLLSSVEGAGEVRVMLSLETGDELIYAADELNGEIRTVLMSQGSGHQSALVRGTSYGRYRGAVVLAQGAESAAVRLRLTEAVSALTGLNAGNICVLKMKGTG